MAKYHDAPRKPGAWRFLKYLLPLLFLFSGFFGIQVWMAWDEQHNEVSNNPALSDVPARNAKSDLARLTESSGTVSNETMDSPSKTSFESEQAIASEIPGLEYYRLQAGSFKENKGAEKLQKKLEEIGYGSLIVQNGSHYEVIAMAFFNREQAKALQFDMESQGISCYPDKITIPSNAALLQADSQRLQSFMDGPLTEIPEMLRELCDCYYRYESQDMDARSHEILIIKQISRLSDMQTGVESMQVDKEDVVLQVQLKEYLAKYVRYLEMAKTVESLDRELLWPGLLDRIETFGRLGVRKMVN